MRRRIVLLSLMFVAIIGNAQIFNTSGILRSGDVAIGFEPSMLVSNGSNEFLMFFHAGVGVGRNIDVGAKVGAFGDDNYYGGDIEFGILENLSLSAGAHYFRDFAIDATANVSIPLVAGTKLITGLDIDYIVDHSTMAVWLPLGIRVNIGNGWSLIMESEIELTNDAYHYFGVGMAYGF